MRQRIGQMGFVQHNLLGSSLNCLQCRVQKRATLHQPAKPMLKALQNPASQQALPYG
jgi:hypothetical protein